LDGHTDRRDQPVFRIDEAKGADDLDRLAADVRRIDRVEDGLLHRPVYARAGILVLDLVLEIAEGDVARNIAQFRTVDGRTGLDPDTDVGRNAFRLEVIDARLSLAHHARE